MSLNSSLGNKSETLSQKKKKKRKKERKKEKEEKRTPHPQTLHILKILQVVLEKIIWGPPFQSRAGTKGCQTQKTGLC